MRYMNINSSCAYTALANALLVLGHDVEDHQILKEAGVPYLFDYDGTYRCGVMLRNKVYFDLYLHKYNFEIIERTLSPLQVIQHLKNNPLTIINWDNQLTHLLIEYRDNTFFFLCPRRKNSVDEDYFCCDEKELRGLLNKPITVWNLKQQSKGKIDYHSLLANSIIHLKNYQKDIADFFSAPLTPKKVHQNKDNLLRPLILDLVPMVAMIDNAELVKSIRIATSACVKLVRSIENSCGLYKVKFEDINQFLEKFIVFLQEHLNKKHIFSR